MKKTLLISGVLLALAASTAMAGGINLSWTDCGSFGTQARTFACTSNSGSNTLTASYDPNAAVADFVGNELRIDTMAADPALPAWWQMFNSGSCRGTAVPTVNAGFGTGNCADNFAAAGFGVIGFYNQGTNTSSLFCGWAITEGVPIAPGTEYYAINVNISNSRTVGTPSCAGCTVGMCLVLNVISLAYGPSATLVQTIDNPLNRNWVTWQGGAAVPGGCPGATPNTNKTWGQVKALYR